MAPEEMEPELRHGAWLILLEAVWSAPDRDAIRTALEVAKEFSNGFQVGLRIFDHHDETRVWCPEARERYGSPVWIILNERRFVEERFGTLGLQDVREMAGRVVGD
jgi:hypothetical protein